MFYQFLLQAPSLRTLSLIHINVPILRPIYEEHKPQSTSPFLPFPMGVVIKWPVTLQSLVPNFFRTPKARQQDLSIFRGILEQPGLLLRHTSDGMEQLIEELIQKLVTARDASPSTSHPTPDLNHSDTLVETQSKGEAFPSAENSSAETATMNFESQGAPCQGQASTAAGNSFPTEPSVAIANTLHPASAPAATPMMGETKPIPAVRYLTYRQEVFAGDHGIPAFGWLLTSPEGQTTWMYIT